jgi:transcriptional regulator with XRE-family HTH domain
MAAQNQIEYTVMRSKQREGAGRRRNCISRAFSEVSGTMAKQTTRREVGTSSRTPLAVARLSYLIGALGWTVSELAKRSGVAERTITAWEGKRPVQPNRVQYHKVLAAFGLKDAGQLDLRYENDWVPLDELAGTCSPPLDAIATIAESCPAPTEASRDVGLPSAEELADEYLTGPLARKHHAVDEKKGLDYLRTAYGSKLFTIGGEQAFALRLFGAGAEAFTAHSVTVELSEIEYQLPEELHKRKDRILHTLTDQARVPGAQFYAGPCIGLRRYRFSPTAAAARTNEEKHLWLELAPLTWSDYSIANDWFSKILLAKMGMGDEKNIRHYLDLNRVANDGALQDIKLSNLMSTATTLLTTDGYLTYSMRSSRVSTQPSCLGVVMENIQPHKDESRLDRDADGLPLPFRTAKRGIREEISTKVAASLNSKAIYLLGIAFDLEVFEPDLLFLAALPLTRDELLKLHKENTGVDFHEAGELRFARALPTDPNVVGALTPPASWAPTGQASFMRAAQFIEAVCDESGQNLRKVAEQLSRGAIPSAEKKHDAQGAKQKATNKPHTGQSRRSARSRMN